MIHIGKPYITEDGEQAYLKAPVTISEESASVYTQKILPWQEYCIWLTDEDYPPAAWDEDGTLWFGVPLEYGKYLCKERSNAFIVALFWYAMVSGSDISFEAPISKRLYDGFTTMLMPALEEGGFAPIALKGPVTDEPVWCEGAVLTGMTAGVDSQYTLKTYGADSVPQDERLTHLCYYPSNGLFKREELYKGVDALYDKQDKKRSFIIKIAQLIARENNLPLIITRTNLDRDYYRGGLIYMGMYRFMACTLALEHLFRLYVSSSSGHGNGMVKVSLFVPTQQYEDLLCRSLHTETLKYVSSDHDSRVKKLKALADNPVFQKTVSVCFDMGSKGENCGFCAACMSTMIPLDIMGKLDQFGESFDLDRYYNSREDIYRELIRFSKRPEASSARETVKQILELADEEPGPCSDLFKEIYLSEEESR